MADLSAAVDKPKRPRGRPRKASYGPADLLPATWRDTDDLAALVRSGNARLADDDLSRLCGVTPAMVYALREIAEGRNPSNGVRAADVIEAFEKMARYGHAPAKGAAKAPDADTQRQVIIVIRPPLQIGAAAPAQTTIDITPEPAAATNAKDS